MLGGRHSLFGSLRKAETATFVKAIGTTGSGSRYITDSQSGIAIGDLMVLFGQGGAPGGGSGASWNQISDGGLGGSGYWYYRLYEQGDIDNPLYMPSLTCGAVWRGPTRIGPVRAYHAYGTGLPCVLNPSGGFQKSSDYLGLLFGERYENNSSGNWYSHTVTARANAYYTTPHPQNLYARLGELHPSTPYVNNTPITYYSSVYVTVVVVELLA